MKKLLLVIIGLIIASWAVIHFQSNVPIKNANPSGRTIICFGDSLTFGTGAARGKSYPDQLSEMIGLPIINAGVPGDTTASALLRLTEDVLDHSPDFVLITLGGNDLKNNVPKKKAFDNLEAIIHSIQKKGALVIIGGIDLPIWGRGFGDGYETTARQTGSVLIPNIFKGIWGHNNLMSDTIHPNAKGYQIMASYFRDAIEPYLD